MHALFSVCSLRDDNVITNKPASEAYISILEHFEQCCCPWPWFLALRCPRGQILSPWPWLILQGTSEPQNYDMKAVKAPYDCRLDSFDSFEPLTLFNKVFIA